MIKKKDVEGVSKISSFFKPNTNVGDDEKCENPTKSQIIEMPHRSLEEKLKPWPHRRKNLCRQVLQEHVRCINSDPKRKTLKYLTQILLPYNLLTKGSSPYKNTKVSICGFIFHMWKRAFYASTANSSVSPYINKDTHPTRVHSTYANFLKIRL